MQYWFSTSTEEFTPSEMLEQAKAAERAGFDGLGTSDHFAPWFPDGQAAQAWVYLGALGQASQTVIGTGVTPIVHHYHPGVVAQAFMSLEELYPGRVFLGAGPGEAGQDAPEALRLGLRPAVGPGRRALRRRPVDARRSRAGTGDRRGLPRGLRRTRPRARR